MGVANQYCIDTQTSGDDLDPVNVWHLLDPRSDEAGVGTMCGVLPGNEQAGWQTVLAPGAIPGSGSLCAQCAFANN